MGVWGGTCTCPNGEQYLVGDNVNYCGSLACYGGASGECIHEVREGPTGWARRKVTCGVPEAPHFDDILNPPETARMYSSADRTPDSALSSGLGWAAAHDTQGQWVRIDLGETVEIIGIALQKPKASSSYVTSVKVEVQKTTTGVALEQLSVYGRNEFAGPSADTASEQMTLSFFGESIFARVVTVRPVSWEGSIGLRVGLLSKHKERYQEIPGLTAAKCDGMLRDPTHLFRRMWAAEAWAKQYTTSAKCWERDRENYGWGWQKSERFFDDILEGNICDSNWYEGNNGAIGGQYARPTFTGDAKAVLGFDDSIDRYCTDHAPWTQNTWGHAPRCIAANANILSLYGTRIPYNICRNLEWQSCAARGLLPGQKSKTLIFSRAPNDLDPSGKDGHKPLGQCRGWVPPQKPKGGVYGYATDDIYFLEVCLYNQICENGAELFDIQQDQPFVCRFSETRFRELQEILMVAHEEPPGTKECYDANV